MKKILERVEGVQGVSIGKSFRDFVLARQEARVRREQKELEIMKKRAACEDDNPES